MGDNIKVNTVNSAAARREALEPTYNLVNGITEEPSVWSHFSPSSLAVSIAFPLGISLFQKNPLPIKAAANSTAFGRARLMDLKETFDRVNTIKSKNPFAQAEVLKLKNDIKNISRAGNITAAELSAINKQYINAVAKNPSGFLKFLDKPVAKVASKLPSWLGTEVVKNLKCGGKMMLLWEVGAGLLETYQAFDSPREDGKKGINWKAGGKQLAKSTGKAAVGWTGYLAGAAAGAKLGAAICSIIPGIGTAAGAIIGGAIGFVVGGFTSQVAKNAYEAVLPDELDIQHEKRLEALTNDNDRSLKNKKIMEEECAKLSDAYNSLAEGLTQAQESGDEATAQIIKEQMKGIEKSANIIGEAYQRKFNEAIVKENNQANEQVKTTPTEATNNTSSLISQNYMDSLNQYNQYTPYNQFNPMLVNNYSNPAQMPMNVPNFGATGFDNFANITPTQDWASMLSYQDHARILGLA